MDFLLECVGFPPEADPATWVALARTQGEAVPWRGDPENHLRLALGSGLELRADREPHRDFWTLLPHYRPPERLRIAVEELRRVPDSPFDALLTGWAAPPGPEDHGEDSGAFLFTTWLTDAGRLSSSLAVGHVLAISVAGFALHIDYVGPNSGVRDARWLERPRGAYVAPLRGSDGPGGCAEVSLRVREVRHLRNRHTGRLVDLLLVDAPGRPLTLFVSPWQLAADGLSAPRPGWRVEGTFLFSGTIAGGLPGPKSVVSESFG